MLNKTLVAKGDSDKMVISQQDDLTIPIYEQPPSSFKRKLEYNGQVFFKNKELTNRGFNV